jgi:hypothetical protein
VVPQAFRHPVGLALLALSGVTCSFPTDKSEQVTVVVESPGTVVIRGQQLPLEARAFRVSGADTVEVPNASFLWASTDANLATVQPQGGAAAAVTGVNSGTVAVTARAIAFEQAAMGSLLVRVADALEVDSVRPRNVRFGDTVTVYGVGVDSIFFATLENATLLDYPIPFLLPTRTRDAQGLATATFWVPPPARAGVVSYIGPGVFGQAPESTFVLPIDILEPNETAPREIDLDVSPPRFPAVPILLFFNPALAFEALPRDVKEGIEWYRFSQNATRDVTLILGGPNVRGTFDTYVTDSLAFTGTTFVVGPTSWTFGPKSHACSGFAFEPDQFPPESTIVALHDLPAGALHSISVYRQPGNYSLQVREGYVVTNPLIPRDPHEEDDFCTAPGAATPVVSLSPGAAWRDTLTIDNPHDVDWIRFRVGGLGAQLVTLRIGALAGAVDSSDIDLYVLTVPGGGASPSLTEIRRATNFGSSETITATLSPGDYYAVVVDYVGRPVRYAVCIDVTGVPCNPFPSSPVTGRTGARSSGTARATGLPVRVRERDRD